MYSLQLRDGIVIPSPALKEKYTNKELYSKLMKCIYDGLLPVTRVIGFKINDSSNGGVLSAVSRSANVLENNIELTKNLAEMLIVEKFSDVMVTRTGKGKVYTDTQTFKSDGNSVVLLQKKCYLFTAINPVELICVVHTSTGYRTMEENIKIINRLGFGEGNKDIFFPLNTDHTLRDYIKLIPVLNENDPIRYRIVNEGREDRLERVLNKDLGRFL